MDHPHRQLRSRKVRSRSGVEGSKSRTEPVDEHSIDEPLIDPSIVDLATQRRFAVLFFIIIQCWKIYDVISLKTGANKSMAGGILPLNGYTFFFKYAVAEGAYLGILSFMNIPYLMFSPWKSLFFTVILNMYTLVLASDTTLPILSGILLPVLNSVYKRKELTIVGDAVNSQNVVDMNAHFKGRYTIQFLPDSSAKFNPFQFENLCLDSTQKSEQIYMPIEFNTTNSIGFLQIEHLNELNEARYINFTYQDLSKLQNQDYSHLEQYPNHESIDVRVFYIEVPINEPGAYKIKSVKDVKGINIRSYKSTVLISYCPNVKYIHDYEHDNTRTCIGKHSGTFDIKNSNLKFPMINSFGVTPLTVKINTRLNGKKHYDFAVEVGDGNSTSRNIGDLSWLKSNEFSQDAITAEVISNPNLISSKTVGILEFQISEIVDSLGHVMRFNPTSRNKDIFHSIELHREPTISLNVANPDELLLINGTKTLLITPIASDFGPSDFPLTIVLNSNQDNEPLLSQNVSRTFEDFSSLKAGIQVDKPGTYTLLSGKSKHCPCEVDEKKNQAIIEVASLPSVDINAEPIVDKCVGMTGYNFTFDFSGKPPFQLEYQVFQEQSNGLLKPLHNNHGQTKRYLKSFDPQYEFVYKPPGEGTYLVVFKSLKDMNYNVKPILLDEKKHTYSTYFKQRSSAWFGSKLKLVKTCLNEGTTIPLNFKGNPPFSFEYSIIDTTSNKKVVNEKVANVENDTYEIKTPLFSKGGDYSVVVSDLKDTLSCDVDFNYNDIITIRTRSDIPKISFGDNFKNKHIKIVEGDSLRIPLNLKSSTGISDNDSLGYSITSLTNKSIVQNHVLRDTERFHVQEEGVYELSSFKSGGCPGKISESKEVVHVSYHTKPSLHLDSRESNVSSKIDSSLHLKPVCENCANGIVLRLLGAPPFVVDYEVTLPSGKVESRTIAVESEELSIDLPTDRAGRYKHNFKAVYDQHYTREKIARLRSKGRAQPASIASITYDVHPLPNVLFDSKDKFFQICESSIDPTKPIANIPINFVGQYPFNIVLSMMHETTGKVDTIRIDDVSELSLKLNDLYESMTVGNHILTIDEVIDGNGCKRNDFSELNNFVVAITEVPNITKRSLQSHYCVGDHISYNMSGSPPFTVYYDFNDRHQKAESAQVFQRLASKPGNLSIVALSDSSMNRCLVNFTDSAIFEDLQIQIYDLPSVEINQGDFIVQDIHEGDQVEMVFSLEGVPPFTLTYVRWIEVIDPKTKKEKGFKIVEKKTVEGIWEHEYVVHASLEGTYEAVELRDAYCVARRYEEEYE
ncbi:nucleoporin Pom152p [[Candida] anglica]|uniref:Nucleoporin Pom152p n=1 Tax=[Candida] anglica TaxID=148631 RepID=A0ABP0E851_9ASCO